FSEPYGGRRVAIVGRLAGELPCVRVDDTEIREVVVNLLHNAIDAVVGKGSVTVETFAQGRRVAVSVSDTGVGIPPEIRDLIFVPFFTTKQEAGTGLGLAVCSRIAADHGGDLEVDSEVGKGSTFTLWLPAESG